MGLVLFGVLGLDVWVGVVIFGKWWLWELGREFIEGCWGVVFWVVERGDGLGFGFVIINWFWEIIKCEGMLFGFFDIDGILLLFVLGSEDIFFSGELEGFWGFFWYVIFLNCFLKEYL